MRSFYKNRSLPSFLVENLLLKLIILTQLSLVQLLQKYTTYMHKMGKNL